VGKAESQSKIGETTSLENIKESIDELEARLDEFKKCLVSIGGDTWRVQTV
jgi:hypothetical protein